MLKLLMLERKFNASYSQGGVAASSDMSVGTQGQRGFIAVHVSRVWRLRFSCFS